MCKSYNHAMSDGANSKSVTAEALGATPLLLACGVGNLETVTMLLAEGKDPNEANRSGRTGLIYAAAGGSVAVLDALLDAGAERDRVDADGWSALHVAVSNRQRGRMHGWGLNRQNGLTGLILAPDGKSSIWGAGAGHQTLQLAPRCAFIGARRGNISQSPTVAARCGPCLHKAHPAHPNNAL